MNQIHFDTDYMEGAHPDVMQRLVESNLEQTTGYGTDPYTQQAKGLIMEACCLDPERAEVHFLVGGTQTNSTVIDGLLHHHEGVMAAETGHINVHESGAIEASGHKVLTLPSHQGKVLAHEVEHYVNDFYRDETYEHMVAPGLLYISQPTEYGTLYTLSELQELSDVCHSHDIPLYIDGARLAYALASPRNDVTLPQLATLADAFYIGGTKCGLLFGEAVVVPRGKELLPHFFPLVKQHGALLAKGRLLGLQFGALFADGLYFRLGAHAVALALKIKAAFADNGYTVYIDSYTNQQFFRLPNTLIDRLSSLATFELWGPRGEEQSVVRFVTSWATREADVEALIQAVRNDKEEGDNPK
ncbi:MAG: threonine aldolase family protein [Bacteroides sp.]